MAQQYPNRQKEIFGDLAIQIDELDLRRTVCQSPNRGHPDWERENPPEEYDQSIFDDDAEDRALASTDAEG